MVFGAASENISLTVAPIKSLPLYQKLSVCVEKSDLFLSLIFKTHEQELESHEQYQHRFVKGSVFVASFAAVCDHVDRSARPLSEETNDMPVRLLK